MEYSRTNRFQASGSSDARKRCSNVSDVVCMLPSEPREASVVGNGNRHSRVGCYQILSAWASGFGRPSPLRRAD